MRRTRKLSPTQGRLAMTRLMTIAETGEHLDRPVKETVDQIMRGVRATPYLRRRCRYYLTGLLQTFRPDEQRA